MVVYKRANVTLHNADCMEQMPFMRYATMDMLLTDPPTGNGHKSRKNSVDMIHGNDKKFPIEDFLRRVCKLIRKWGHLWIFGPWRDRIKGLPITFEGEHVWFKELLGLGGPLYRPGHEYVQHLINTTEKKKEGYPLPLYTVTNLRPTMRNGHHVYEKPVELLEQYIEFSSRRGQTVFDPYAGSGSVLIAAALRDRPAVGMEIDPKYFKIASDRIDRVLDLKEKIDNELRKKTTYHLVLK